MIQQQLKFILLSNNHVLYIKQIMMIIIFRKKFILIIILFSIISCRKKGCTDPFASNYDDKANYENGSCEYDTINRHDFELKTYHFFNSNKFHLDFIYLDDFGNKI